jgi:translocator protein
MVMNISSQGRLTVVNFIGLRMGFSVYSGWVTSATILNVSIMLKAFGVNETDMAGLDEAMVGIVILIIAECIYIGASLYFSNPLYASVFIWVLFAIRD